ncbi:MAG: hypothetical protein ACLTKE_04805 [Coprococcus sp.]
MLFSIEGVLNTCGYSYVKGKLWTSDGIYRETLPVIQERREEGCLVVEMECASMLVFPSTGRFRLCNFCMEPII